MAIHAKIRHPNVVQCKKKKFPFFLTHSFLSFFLYQTVLGGIFTDDDIYMVTEWLPVGDMDSIVRYGVEYPVEKKIQWMYQLALAIHYLHEVGVIHFDMKLANCFLSEDLVLKLGGLSKYKNQNQF